jgi:hypothetical protein
MASDNVAIPARDGTDPWDDEDDFIIAAVKNLAFRRRKRSLKLELKAGGCNLSPWTPSVPAITF